VERGNKHGFRLDDAMAAEVEPMTRGGAPIEPRVEEWREMEPAGEDQETSDARLSGNLHAGDPYPGLSTDELELRADLARHLRVSAFPANRQLLEEVAIDEGAPASVLDMLRALPDGRSFANVAELWETLGHTVETRQQS
jgi:hypothetical protein